MWSSPRHRGVAGFTLLEILVVVLIIGIVTAGAMIAVGVTGSDRELQNEAERVRVLLGYAQEQAELQTRELGLYCDADMYQFLAFDARRDLWVPLPDDDVLRERKLPPGISLSLAVEARPVVLRRPPDEKDIKPQVMIFSNRDLTPFELTLDRESGGKRLTVAADEQGRIETRDDAQQKR